MSYQDPYAPQDIYAQQQQLGKSEVYGGTPSYTQPNAYGQPGAYPSSPQPPYGQPGAYPPPYGQPGAYPPPQAYGQPLPYAPPQQNYRQSALRGGNPWANRALYSGVISAILALITIASNVGFAGLITGAFAIYRGITALTLANRLPGNPGRIQAILAIVLGVTAWVLVFISFGLRGLAGS